MQNKIDILKMENLSTKLQKTLVRSTIILILNKASIVTAHDTDNRRGKNMNRTNRIHKIRPIIRNAACFSFGAKHNFSSYLQVKNEQRKLIFPTHSKNKKYTAYT
ncbi:hypothetical protein D1007_27998 [Hordeum vulgare]|nr:hypothetical protein D1007_27998 [Hordeum vulgare]